MTSRSPKFSVIIPVFNRKDTVAAAMKSVLAQSCGDFELIVADDGSMDDTSTSIAEVDDPRILHLWQPHSGVSAARNHGLQRAAGTYIAFLDSDDEAEVEWLACLQNVLDDGHGVASCAITFWANGRAMKTFLPEHNPLYRGERALFLAGSYAVRRDVALAIGGFDERLRHAENTDFGIRAIERSRAWNLTTGASTFSAVKVRHAIAQSRARPKHDAVLRMLDKHADLFAANPHLRAQWRAIAAVDLARRGDIVGARSVLRDGLRSDGLGRNALRWVATLCPPLARKWWSPYKGCELERAVT